MGKIEINSENRYIYQKFLNIKEGKEVANQKCIFIPVLLISLEALLSSVFILFTPFLDPYMSHLLADFIQIVLYGISIYGITKVNVELSKKMGVYYFKKKYPDIDVDINTTELKQKLKEYQEKDMSIYDMSRPRKTNKVERSLSSYNSHFQNTTNEDKKALLEKEKEFWNQERENNYNRKKEKVIQKKKHL